METRAAEGFGRYQVILDRQPFGTPPAAPVEAPAPQPDFAQALRISALIEDDRGHTRVGFYNQQTQQSFFLGIGDIEDGLELISVALDREEAVLRQGEETVVLQLQSSPVSASAQATPPAARTRGGGDDARRRMMEERRRAYLERRAQRQQEGAEDQPDAGPPPRRRITGVEQQPDGSTRRLRGAELREHLQEYQMEAIRQGLPPLPIPLTPEMDAQLVEEGVLPPQ